MAALIIICSQFLPCTEIPAEEWTLSEAIHTLVNGDPIYTGEIIERRLLIEKAYAAAGKKITPEMLKVFDKDARRSLIHSLLIQQEADKNNISVTEEEVNEYLKSYNREDTELQRRQAKDNLLFDAVLRAERMPSVEPTPREMADYYREHKEKYSIPRLIQARHITVPKATPESRASELRKLTRIRDEALKPGADFVELAKRYGSTSFDRETGGGIFFEETKSMNYFFPPANKHLRENGAYPEEMIAAFIDLKGNQVSEIIESTRGFHLLYIEQDRPEIIYTFQQVQTDILNSISYKKREIRKREWLIGIINRSFITWHNGDPIPTAEIVPPPLTSE